MFGGHYILFYRCVCKPRDFIVPSWFQFMCSANVILIQFQSHFLVNKLDHLRTGGLELSSVRGAQLLFHMRVQVLNGQATNDDIVCQGISLHFIGEFGLVHNPAFQFTHPLVSF